MKYKPKEHISVLFLTRPTWYTDIIIKFMEQNFSRLTIVKEEINGRHLNQTFDYILAFGYQFIVPASMLKNVKVAALNFHPGSTENPGAGSYSYPLFDNQEESGVTCHHMERIPDTGSIVVEKIFPVNESDNFSTLQDRSLIYLMHTFYEVIDTIINGKPLPKSQKQWARKPRLQREYVKETLEIDASMDRSEIEKRIRAANPKYPGPFIKINNVRYTLR